MTEDPGWNFKGEVWGDASAALGVIHRKGHGKTRHIQTGLLWIKQTAAEQRPKFHEALGKQNPADLFIKHLDEGTNIRHTKMLGYEYIEDRAKEAPKLHTISLARYQEAQHSKDYKEWKLLQCTNGSSGGCRGDINIVEHIQHLTCSGLQVLWGYIWPLKGFNGRAIAQPSQLRGSTRIFQQFAMHEAGTSWVQRRGVTMHPRGRYLRDNMALQSHGMSTSLAREQQPHFRPIDYDWRRIGDGQMFTNQYHRRNHKVEGRDAGPSEDCTNWGEAVAGRAPRYKCHGVPSLLSFPCEAPASGALTHFESVRRQMQ